MTFSENTSYTDPSVDLASEADKGIFDGNLDIFDSGPITIDPDLQLSERQQDIIRSVCSGYQNHYGLNYPLSIEPATRETGSVKENNITTTTLAYAQSGVIYLNPIALARMNENTFVNTLVHEMAHTIPRTINDFADIDFSDGQLIAFDGLSIEVRLKDGRETGFKAFEEAFAEYMAISYSIEHGVGYSVSNPIYFALGSLLQKGLKAGSNRRLLEMYQKSDVLGALGVLFDCEGYQLQDVEYVMGLLNELRVDVTSVVSSIQDTNQIFSINFWEKTPRL